MKKVSLLLFPFFFSPFWAKAQRRTLPEHKHNFVVIAHRGNHENAPENTLLAIQNAIDIAADYVEIDLRTTKDGELIIMHDASLERMTQQNGKIKDFTLSELEKIKVFDKEHPEWGQHNIPTFREVLRLCKDKINIYLDFKDASVEKTFLAILAMQMQNQVVVYINNKDQFKDWRMLGPKIPLMISLSQKVSTRKEMLNFLAQHEIDILDGNYTEYNAETVKAAQEMGIPIWADIQSKTEMMYWKAALRTGLSGLQTDHPTSLIHFLNSQHKR